MKFDKKPKPKLAAIQPMRPTTGASATAIESYLPYLWRSREDGKFVSVRRLKGLSNNRPIVVYVKLEEVKRLNREDDEEEEDSDGCLSEWPMLLVEFLKVYVRSFRLEDYNAIQFAVGNHRLGFDAFDYVERDLKGNIVDSESDDEEDEKEEPDEDEDEEDNRTQRDLDREFKRIVSAAAISRYKKSKGNDDEV